MAVAAAHWRLRPADRSALRLPGSDLRLQPRLAGDAGRPRHWAVRDPDCVRPAAAGAVARRRLQADRARVATDAAGGPAVRPGQPLRRLPAGLPVWADRPLLLF